MASTYSTSLRLELMATGDQSGTWGDTTNTNLGTLLEQSITGVLSVAQGDVANLTLTTVNGGTDQARNAVVNLTGALTANRNVVVQTANKLYLIKNSTTGGFSVVAKTAAGTGVTIPPLSSQWVYSDGTNVVAGLIGNMPFNNLLQGYTTTATAAGTTVLDATSTHTQYFTGATTQTITLPVTSTLVLGQEYEIINLSSGSLTVNSSGANLVATVLASATTRVQVILTSGTSAASWNVISASVPNPLTLSGSSVGYTPLVLTSTEAAAAAGPIEDNYRDSASPAASDILGRYIFNGRDSAANKQEYASIEAVIVSPTSTTEASTLDFYIQAAGTRLKAFSAQATGFPLTSAINVGFAASVAASALTVALKGTDGNDPSATNPVFIPFRNVTAATGTPSYLAVTAATSIVISSGSTMGFTSAVAGRLWIVGFNDGGTFRLGLVNALSGTSIMYLRNGIFSSTAEGGAGGADSAQVIYTGTAVTSKAMTILGYLEATEATAGTWATAPSLLKVWQPGDALPGDRIQIQSNEVSASATGTTVIPGDNSIPQSGEGDQYMTQAITPSSATNLLMIESTAWGSHSSNPYVVSALFQDSVANALAVSAGSSPTAGNTANMTLIHMQLAAGTSSTTFKIRIGGTAAGTFTFGGASGTRLFGAVAFSRLSVTELLA